MAKKAKTMRIKQLIESLERLAERAGYGGGPEMEYDPTDYDGQYDDRYDAPPDDYEYDGPSAPSNVADTATVAPSVKLISGQGWHAEEDYREPRVSDQAKVLGKATLQGSVHIKDRAVVKDRAVIDGGDPNAQFFDGGNPVIGGSAKIVGKTVVSGDIKILGGTWDFPAEDPVMPLQRGRNVFKSAESYIEARDKLRQQMRQKALDDATPFEVKRRKELRRRLKAKGLLR